MESRLLVFIAIACAVSRIEGVTITTGTPNITRNGCESSKLCFTTCDPFSNISSCYFGSSKASSDNNSLIFELSGPTVGFVALGLDSTTPGGKSFVFVCGNNNTNNGTSFTFLTGSNDLYNISVNTVYTVQGMVANNQSLNQSYIQCTFNTSTSLTTSTAKSLNINFFVSIFNGIMNGGVPGPLNNIFNSTTRLDLTNPSSNQTNTGNTTVTTATPVQSTTKGGSDSLASPVARALAILLSAMGLLLLY